jgi:hypothetical protein
MLARSERLADCFFFLKGALASFRMTSGEERLMFNRHHAQGLSERYLYSTDDQGITPS